MPTTSSQLPRLPSALPSTRGSHTLSAADSATTPSNKMPSLNLRLAFSRRRAISASGAAGRAHVETLHAAVQGLTGESQALRGTADIAPGFAQARLDGLAADRCLRTAARNIAIRRRAMRG